MYDGLNMRKKTVDYVNELYLKSLCIRVKNRSVGEGTPDKNYRINQLLKTYLALISKQYPAPQLTKKKTLVKEHLKNHIISLSEGTIADDVTYNMFASCILLMIKRILTKPQFSNYTFKDEFYSDATYKVVKYIYNFNHKKISQITGKSVNAFSYITQIIHNSIIFVINKNKRNQALSFDKIRMLVNPEPGQETFFNDPKYERAPLSYTKYIRVQDDVTNEIAFINTAKLHEDDRITYIVRIGLEVSDLFAECACRGISYDVEFEDY